MQCQKTRQTGRGSRYQDIKFISIDFICSNKVLQNSIFGVMLYQVQCSWLPKWPYGGCLTRLTSFQLFQEYKFSFSWLDCSCLVIFTHKMISLIAISSPDKLVWLWVTFIYKKFSQIQSFMTFTVLAILIELFAFTETVILAILSQ